MPCSSNGQRGRQVFRSGHSYLSNQPDTFSSNILTRSRFPKSKTWTKSGCQQASVTRPRVIAPTEAPCQILPLQASLESADREAQRSQHPQSVGSVKGQVVQATLLAVPAASASSSTASENTNPDTRRLIHKGRYKLVQPQGPSRSAPSAQRAAFVQQQSQHLGLHNRKRRFINSSLTVQQTAKRQHTWVRTSTVSQTQGTSSAAAPRSRPSTPALVRSTNSRKLQLVRKLSVSPAGSLSRHFSRNAVLAKRLLSARSLKSTRCSVLGVRAPGVVKPGRLQRIGGVLYKVGGSGSNKSLQRQLTPQTLQKDLAPQAAYVQRGNRLVLRSLLPPPNNLVRRARPVANKASAGRAKPLSVKRTAPLNSRLPKLSGRGIARKSNKLHRGSAPAQAHCLVYCRTGHCKEQQAGKCNLVHDPAAVAVCPAWLQGTCSNAACKLQHCKCPDVMPVCIFYLQGLCTTEDCPYAHVKVDPLAPVCQDFVRGHCPRGTTCTKKHLAPRMIRQLRQSKALQADLHADKSTQHDTDKGAAATDTDDCDLRPSFLRAQHTGVAS